MKRKSKKVWVGLIVGFLVDKEKGRIIEVVTADACEWDLFCFCVFYCVCVSFIRVKLCICR
jgi:hypothetical protein